jgi:hypothetical protein
VQWPTEREIEVVRGRYGEITLYELHDPVALLAVARGVISLPMIRRDVEVATAFARPEGWSYLADIRGVRLIDPRNLFALRRIRSLPGIHHYVVVAPRLLARLAPGDVTSSVANALTRCSAA